MPKKTVTIQDIEKEIKEDKTAERCGHVCKQHYNTKGVLEDLKCTQEAEHTGDHRAKYKKNVADYQYGDKGQIVKVNYLVEEAEAYWGDAAGTPASEISEAPILQMNLHQKDMVMKILQQYPAMNVKEAIARAKMTQEWTAISV